MVEDAASLIRTTLASNYHCHFHRLIRSISVSSPMLFSIGMMTASCHSLDNERDHYEVIVISRMITFRHGLLPEYSRPCHSPAIHYSDGEILSIGDAHPWWSNYLVAVSSGRQKISWWSSRPMKYYRQHGNTKYRLLKKHGLHIIPWRLIGLLAIEISYHNTGCRLLSIGDCFGSDRNYFAIGIVS